MDVHIVRRGQAGYPLEAEQMHNPPEQLYYRGDLRACLARKRVAIVGSRRMSGYGKQTTSQLAREFAEQGIVIVSGLALGVDAQAHRAALEAGGLCLAVLPSPVQTILPTANRRLADQILANGGALISQYSADEPVHKGNFVARNELLARLSHVLIITEAAADSGSLHTARFANGTPTEVRAVPGNITSPLSVGTNQLLKSSGAAAITNAQDVFHLLDVASKTKRAAPRGKTPEQQQLLDLLAQGTVEGETLLLASGQSPAVFNQTLTMLEITGKVMPLGANRWGLP